MNLMPMEWERDEWRAKRRPASVVSVRAATDLSFITQGCLLATRTHAHAHTHTHTRMHARTHARTHTHTHPHTQLLLLTMNTHSVDQCNSVWHSVHISARLCLCSGSKDCFTHCFQQTWTYSEDNYQTSSHCGKIMHLLKLDPLSNWTSYPEKSVDNK